MARAKKPKVNETSVKLLEALRFISMAQKESGPPNYTHCQFVSGRLCATDGVLTVGCVVEDDFIANPETHKLIAALQHCGLSLKITVMHDSLAIVSERFRATVPTVPAEQFADVGPDAPIAALDERLRDAFRAVGPLATDGAQSVLCASVLLGPGYAVATDRHMMIQFWHGIDMPPALVLPKVFVTAVLKLDKPLKAFGCSDRTFTVWFADDSFMKTQLFDEPWPAKWLQIMDEPCNPIEVSTELEPALKAVEAFCENGFVYFGPNIVESHREDKGAKYQVTTTICERKGVNIKYLWLALPYATSISFGSNPEDKIRYFGENVRGCICPIADR